MTHLGRHVYICVNGILSRPGEANGWTDRTVTWLHLHTESRAEKFEYACGAILRRLRQDQRAQAITTMIDFYATAGFSVSLIGHSNGCDLIARVLCLTQHKIASAHLFAAATDAESFRDALDFTNLGRLYLYVSDNDWALRIARFTRGLLGLVNLGYGSLGTNVPEWCRRDARVRITRNDAYGHSDWFQRGENFESTMRVMHAWEKSFNP